VFAEYVAPAAPDVAELVELAEYVVTAAVDVAELVELAEYVVTAAVDVAVLQGLAEYDEAVARSVAAAAPAVAARLVDAAAFVAFSADVAAVRFAFFACRHYEDAAFASVRATV